MPRNKDRRIVPSPVSGPIYGTVPYKSYPSRHGNNPVGSTRACSSPYLRRANTVGSYSLYIKDLSYKALSIDTTRSRYSGYHTWYTDSPYPPNNPSSASDPPTLSWTSSRPYGKRRYTQRQKSSYRYLPSWCPKPSPRLTRQADRVYPNPPYDSPRIPSWFYSGKKYP